ncbi:Heat shock family protein [Musa troglodytarum]|uniref:Heat shock family protein n=1 Tax=Musa troglodytarum TaxID=320322 RepID=A0A9E7GKS2_9LILI|nr:Heat shock family protein [Musa troglodytarum]
MDTKPASVARSYEDFKPTTELVSGEAFDTFLIRLPGFRREHVRVQIDSQGNLRTSGERPLDGRRWSRFVVEFKLPENCSLNEIRAKFENESLHLRLPKLIAPEPVVQIEEREAEKKLQPPKEEKDEAAKSTGDEKMVPRTEKEKVKEKEKDEAAKSNGDKKMVPRTETEKAKEKEKEEKDEAAKSTGDKKMVPRTETEKAKEKKEEKDEAAKSTGDKKMVPRTETEKVKEKEKEEKDEAAKSNGDKKMVPRMETEKVKEKEETNSKEKVEDKKLIGEKTIRPKEEPEKEREEVKDDKEKVEHGGLAGAEQPAWPELGGFVMELSQAGKTLLWKLAAAMLVLLVLVLYLEYKLTPAETRSASR